MYCNNTTNCVKTMVCNNAKLMVCGVAIRDVEAEAGSGSGGSG